VRVAMFLEIATALGALSGAEVAAHVRTDVIAVGVGASSSSQRSIACALSRRTFTPTVPIRSHSGSASTRPIPPGTEFVRIT
jgi:hypothetical protein